MPTYEYVCSKCDQRFDLLQSIKEQPITVCPKDRCGQKQWGKGKVKRAITAGAGLIFKGSGFYITDYRSEKYKEAAKKDAPASTASTGTESKPGGDGKGAAAKADSKSPASGKPDNKPAGPAKTKTDS